MLASKRLRVGDWVQVRSKEEILRTLDQSGQLDGMPFMPEMFALCGQRFQVYKRAHKTCDTVFPTRSRRVDRAVHLDTRCDGSGHGGCQAGCLLFWKEAWLRPISNELGSVSLPNSQDNTRAASATGCAESDVWKSTQAPIQTGDVPVYVCQATQLPYATTNLAWWDVRQYVEDYRSGNVSLGALLRGFVYSMYYNLSQAGVGLGPAMRWLYNKFHPLWRGTLFPRNSGYIPRGEPTPSDALDLQPGDLVRVRTQREILQTVNTANQNRGMSWDAEMVPYCGGTFQVLKRVSKIIDEKTGKMLEMKTPGIILDQVVCQARYSQCRMFCPRSIYPYWREIWLERVTTDSVDDFRTKQLTEAGV